MFDKEPQRFFKSDFFSILKRTAKDSLNSIYTHPFNKQLFDGTLNPEIFTRYLHDDRIYLNHYAKILGNLSARIDSNNNKLKKLLNDLVDDIIKGEQDMQEEYTLPPESRAGSAISAYIIFLQKINETKEPCISLCSILPCFWIYSKLGKKGAPLSLPTNRYKEWINTYSNHTFITATESLVNEINKLAKESSPEIIKEMIEVFQEAVAFELQFFNEVTFAETFPCPGLR